MANYYGAGRSNYFRVKNPIFFVDMCNRVDIEYEQKNDKFVIFGDEDHGDIPSSYYDDEENEYEFDIVDFLAYQLHEDDVFIFMHSGAEGKSYIGGTAFWVNANGETGNIDLSNIYDMAEQANPSKTITKAQY